MCRRAYWCAHCGGLHRQPDIGRAFLRGGPALQPSGLRRQRPREGRTVMAMLLAGRPQSFYVMTANVDISIVWNNKPVRMHPFTSVLTMVCDFLM